MRRAIRVIAGVLFMGVAAIGCADWDNPTALSEIEAETRFEVKAARVETFEEVEMHVTVWEGGVPLAMSRAQLEIEHHAGGGPLVFEMEPEGDGYTAHVMFFEPGEHHIHLVGTPEGHQRHLMAELGDSEIEVHRRHQVIGPYWVELEISPAPVYEGGEAHIHLLVFELDESGAPGAEVSGLEIECEIHDPAGVEMGLVVEEEEAGEYEAAYAFDEAGIYELHVKVEVDGVYEEGEFHVPVLSPEVEDDGDHDDGGNDHGHGH